MSVNVGNGVYFVQWSSEEKRVLLAFLGMFLLCGWLMESVTWIEQVASEVKRKRRVFCLPSEICTHWWSILGSSGNIVARWNNSGTKCLGSISMFDSLQQLHIFCLGSMTFGWWNYMELCMLYLMLWISAILWQIITLSKAFQGQSTITVPLLCWVWV